jgi:hypothetical protein
MTFLRSLLALTRLDHKWNTTVREAQKVEHTVVAIRNYEKKWLQHVKRTEHSRIARMALAYKPKGKRDIGRPKTR